MPGFAFSVRERADRRRIRQSDPIAVLVSDFKGIPIVPAAEPSRAAATSIAPRRASPRSRTASRPQLRREPLDGRAQAALAACADACRRGFDAVRATVRSIVSRRFAKRRSARTSASAGTPGTATLMLMGAVCTRACRFCAVDTGNPRGWLDSEEPANSARTVQLMRLKYVVLTSVNRDDLADGGAAHFAACVREIKRLNPGDRRRSAHAGFPGRARRCRDGRSAAASKCSRRTSRRCVA